MNEIERQLLRQAIDEYKGPVESRCLILMPGIWNEARGCKERGQVFARQLLGPGGVWVWYWFDGYGNRVLIRGLDHLETLFQTECVG